MKSVEFKKALILKKEAEYFRKQCKYKISTDFYESALAIFTKHRKWSLSVWCLNGILANAIDLGDHSTADKCAKIAYNLSTKKNFHKGYGTISDIYNNIGSFYYVYSYDMYTASKYNEMGISIMEKYLNKFNPDFSPSYNNQAKILEELEKYDKALEFHKKGMDIIEYKLERLKSKNSIEQMKRYKARHLMGIASISNKKNDYSQAIYLYKEVLKLIRVTNWKNTIHEGFVLNALAAISLKMGKERNFNLFINASFHILQNLENINTDDGIRRYACSYYKNLALYHSKKKNFSRALNNIQLSVKYCVKEFKYDSFYENPTIENTIFYKDLLDILTIKFEIYKKYFNHRKDIKTLISCLEICKLILQLVDKFLESYCADESKVFFLKKTNEIYENTIETAENLFKFTGDKIYFDTAFLCSEKFKSNISLEYIFKNRDILFKKYPVLKKERELRKKIAFYKKKIALEKIENETSRIIPILEHKLLKWEYDHQKLSKKIKSLKDFIEPMSGIKNFTVNDLQKEIINDGSVMLEYFVGRRNIYIFVLSKEHTNVIRKKKEKDFENYVKSTINCCCAKSQYDTMKTVQFFLKFRNNSHKLFKILIETVKIEKYFRKGYENADQKRIIIIPDNILGQISFESLVTAYKKRYRRSYYYSVRYLIEQYQVSYASSAKFLMSNRTYKKKGNGMYLGMAVSFKDKNKKWKVYDEDKLLLPQLNNSIAEIDFPSSYFKGLTLKESNASKKNFLKYSKKYSLIHISTHAFTNQNNLKFSRILFYPDTNHIDNSYLFSYEPYNLELNASLIILSACSTGSGKIILGEGVDSLSRSFMGAGVDSIIMTLWSINEETTLEIFKNFYKELFTGKNISESLYIAKRNFLLNNENEIIRDPYYWAGIVYVGKNNHVLTLSTIKHKLNSM